MQAVLFFNFCNFIKTIVVQEFQTIAELSNNGKIFENKQVLGFWLLWCGITRFNKPIVDITHQYGQSM